MSTPNKYRPGFTCRAVRMYASLGSGESALAHLESCAACRDFFRAGEVLEATLRREAAPREVDVPVALESGILRAVRTSEPPAVPARSLFPILAGAAALVAAMATVFISRPPAADALAVADQGRGDVAAVTEVADAVSDQFWTSLIPSVEAVVQGNPLPEELSLVVADARRALDFLALNFLPSPAVAGGTDIPLKREDG